MNKRILCFVLWALATSAHAVLPGKGHGQLFTVSEWNQVCAGQGSAKLVATCRMKLHRAVAYGRSLGPFELVTPADQDLLQSRSGVLFTNSLNAQIIEVKEDTGLRTTVRLPDDVQCQAYSSARDWVGVLGANSHQALIDSWLQTYTDASSRVLAINIGRKDSMQAFKFDAVTEGGRMIRGTFGVDQRANAAIFMTCDHPGASAQAQRNVESFFRSIVGSARKFI